MYSLAPVPAHPLHPKTIYFLSLAWPGLQDSLSCRMACMIYWPDLLTLLRTYVCLVNVFLKLAGHSGSFSPRRWENDSTDALWASFAPVADLSSQITFWILCLTVGVTISVQPSSHLAVFVTTCYPLSVLFLGLFLGFLGLCGLPRVSESKCNVNTINSL